MFVARSNLHILKYIAMTFDMVRRFSLYFFSAVKFGILSYIQLSWQESILVLWLVYLEITDLLST